MRHQDWDVHFGQHCAGHAAQDRLAQSSRREVGTLGALAPGNARGQAHGVDALYPGCDNAPAFVPLRDVGHGVDANGQVGIDTVPAFQYLQVLIAPVDRLSASGSSEQPEN